MSEWNGKEDSCACDCGFNIPYGGALNYLYLTKMPLDVPSGGTGSNTKDGARNNLGFFAGQTSEVSISATSPKTVNIPFPIQFASIPNVIVTPRCAAVADESYGIFFYVQNVTEEGCTVRLTTNYGGNLSVSLQWLAIGDH